jgi:hypothetical protein
MRSVKYETNKETVSSEKILETSRQQNSITLSWVFTKQTQKMRRVKYETNKERASSEKILEAPRQQNSITISWVFSPIKILSVQSWEVRRDSLNFLDINVMIILKF